MNGKIIMVTGGWGYLGSVLVLRLLQAGYRVRVVDPHLHDLSFLGVCQQTGIFDWLPLDLVHHENVPEFFDDVGAIVHLGELGLADCVDAFPDHAVRLNYHGSLSLARRAKLMGIQKFIYASTCSLYAGSGESIVHEHSALKPKDLHAKLKIETETQLLAMSGQDFAVTVLRIPSLFGLSPRMRFDLVANLMVRDAWRGRVVMVHGSGQQIRPFIHVNDAACGIQAVLEKNSSEVHSHIFNMGREDLNMRISDLAREVSTLFLGTQLVAHPELKDHRLYRVSFQKWSERIGLSFPTGINQGLTEMAQQLEAGLYADPLHAKYGNLTFFKDQKSFLYGPLFAARSPLWEEDLRPEKQRLLEKPYLKDASHEFRKRWPQKPRVIGVIVVRNGASNLALTLNQVDRDIVDEIVLVDDGSHDATAQVARHLGLKVLRHETPMGYGACLKIGVQKALKLGAVYVLEMGADAALCSREHLEEALTFLCSHVDVVMGSRLHPPYHALVQGMNPWLYGWCKLKSFFMSLFLGRSVEDPAAQVKFYRAGWIEKMPMTNDGADPFFGTRLLYFAAREGARWETFSWPYHGARQNTHEMPFTWRLLARGVREFMAMGRPLSFTRLEKKHGK